MLEDNILGVRYRWWPSTISTSTRFALSWKRVGTVTVTSGGAGRASRAWQRGELREADRRWHL